MSCPGDADRSDDGAKPGGVLGEQPGSLRDDPCTSSLQVLRDQREEDHVRPAVGHAAGVARHTLAHESCLLRNSLGRRVPGSGEQLDPLEAVVADCPFGEHAGGLSGNSAATSPRRHPVAHLGDPGRPVDSLEIDRTSQSPGRLDREHDAGSRLALARSEGADEPFGVGPGIRPWQRQPAQCLNVLARFGDVIRIGRCERTQDQIFRGKRGLGEDRRCLGCSHSKIVGGEPFSEIDADKRQQSRGIQMLVDGVGQAIKHGLASRGKPLRIGVGPPPHARLGRNLGQEHPPESVVLQGSVPGRPPHRPALPAIQERLRVNTVERARAATPWWISYAVTAFPRH